MPEKLTIKTEALEPLFAAWEEPDKHRVRADSGEGAVERKGRRPSGIAIAQNLRAMVKEWRDNFHFGASDTLRHLLNHWFGRAHTIGTNGSSHEFRYYFCQREAVETLIYLKEFRKLECLSQLIAEFGGVYAETAALGVTEEEDAWSRYAFKMATGSGKTKVMSLAIVWSYFHALRESDSPMARHFVVIAPNLTVFERLKEDFKPEGGGPDTSSCLKECFSDSKATPWRNSPGCARRRSTTCSTRRSSVRSCHCLPDWGCSKQRRRKRRVW